MAESPFTAVVLRSGDWWIGWVAEVPGVNAQAPTREELFADLRSAMDDLFELNRAEARAAAEGRPFEEVAFEYRRDVCHEAP